MAGGWVEIFDFDKSFWFKVYINLATGVGMEEKRDVAFAHKKVLNEID